MLREQKLLEVSEFFPHVGVWEKPAGLRARPKGSRRICMGPQTEAFSLFVRVVLQDVVRAERVVLAGAALVP